MKNKLSCFLFLLFTSTVSIGQVLADGEYFIKVNKTGKYLAISGGGNDNGAQLVQWDFANQRNHKFMVTQLKDNSGAYMIQAVHSGKFISTTGRAVRGSKIIQWQWANQVNQKWLIVPTVKGWTITCLDKRQRFHLTGYNSGSESKNGTYFIINNDEAALEFTFKKNEL